MPVGPLRRFVGILGLVALVPTLLMVAQGEVSLVDAAVRATVTVVVVLALGRVVSWGMGALASDVESSAPARAPAHAHASPPGQSGGGAARPEEQRVS